MTLRSDISPGMNGQCNSEKRHCGGMSVSLSESETSWNFACAESRKVRARSHKAFHLSMSMNSICEECTAQEAKYTCPSCLVKTCSLTCVNSHKERLACNGTKSVTDYVSMKEFTDHQLVADFNYLEDVGRLVGGAKRDKKAMSQHKSTASKLDRLVRMCALPQRDIELVTLPGMMVRRKKNKSYYCPKEKVVHWTIGWLVGNEDTETLVHRRVESSTWRENIPRYTDYPEESMLLLKTPNCPANAPEYSRINLDSSIIETLKGRVVIEYPQVRVLGYEEEYTFTIT